MNKYIEEFTDLISNCSMDNTYKMAWCRALVEYSCREAEKHFKQQEGVVQSVLNTRIGDGPRKLDKLSLIDAVTLMPKKNYSNLI